jgi:hypothetical protein
MCNHIYTGDYSISPKGMGSQCPYPALYTELGTPLPIDPAGACIFHSREAVWKRKQGFRSQFQQLLHILDAQQGGPSYYDFAEFVFVAESPGEKSGETALHLTLTFQKHAIFNGSSFLDAVEFTGLNFQDGAKFTASTFHGDVDFNCVRFRGVEFTGALFRRKVAFRKVTSESYALFSKARFVGMTVSFDESSFEGITEFSSASFELEDMQAVVRFSDVRFSDFLDFKEAVFKSQVIFENVSFGYTTEFIDTTFQLVASTARYRGAAVEFKQIEVPENADLTFKSTSAAKRLFSHDVSFSFKKEPQGLIHFENVNFNELTPESRRILIGFAKLGKVEIGPGCIKYRFQTEVRTIPISEGNTPLILELAQTFATYFTAQSGINLGLEVVERTSTYISFFYFTDEDIREAEFLERLAQTEQDLWNLLAVKPDIFQLLDGGTTGEYLTSPKAAVINAVDGISALIGTFFRVGIRIAIGRWNEYDTKSLLEAIRFNPRDMENRAASLHEVLHARYTGLNLMDFSRAQNRGLPAIESTARNLLTGKSESGDSRMQASKVTILFLGANGSVDSSLQLEEEVSKIQMNLKLAKERDNLIFRQEWAVTIDSLLQAILDEKPGIVHFSGHGNQSGILLHDPKGRPALVPSQALESLFKLFKDSISCVLLNSCFSEHQAKAIRAHIPYVIGVASKIPDDAAIAFSVGFYKGIGAGKDVPFAFELGKVAMELWGVADENATVLL